MTVEKKLVERGMKLIDVLPNSVWQWNRLAVGGDKGGHLLRCSCHQCPQLILFRRKSSWFSEWLSSLPRMHQEWNRFRSMFQSTIEDQDRSILDSFGRHVAVGWTIDKDEQRFAKNRNEDSLRQATFDRSHLKERDRWPSLQPETHATPWMM